MIKNPEDIIKDLENLQPDESYDKKEDNIFILKTDHNNYMVETMIYLFGKPAWEINVEGCDLNLDIIKEIDQLATDLHDHLKNTAKLLKLFLDKQWQGTGGLYDITVYKNTETPEEALTLCKELRQIQNEHEKTLTQEQS